MHSRPLRKPASPRLWAIRRCFLGLLLPVLLCVCLVSSCKRNHPPNTPDTPSGPTSLAPGDTGEFWASSWDEEMDSTSFQFDWGGGDTSGWTPFSQFPTAPLRHAWFTPGLFEVRARARDNRNASSGWSPALPETVANAPPGMPATPSGPNSALRDSLCTFGTTTTDREGDSVAIRFAWGDGDTSVWSGWFAPTETVGLAHAWAQVGTYQVRAQARDSGGGLSAWSDSVSITVWPTTATQRWRSFTDHAVSGTPAVGPDGTIYASCGDKFWTVHPDGSFYWNYWMRWSVFYREHITTSPALAPDGTVYFGTGYEYDWPRLVALGPDGSGRWSLFCEVLQICGSPALAVDGTIYFGESGTALRTARPDGSAGWAFNTAGPVNSAPAVGADGTVYFGSDDGWLYAVNSSGVVVWTFITGGAVTAGPAIGFDGTLFFGSADCTFYAVSQSGSELWHYQSGGRIEASAAIGTDNTVYFGSSDGFLYALNPSGQLEWRRFLGGVISSPPAIAADGTIYVCSTSGFLYALSSDGQPVSRFGPIYIAPQSGPTIAPDGTVYFGSDDGYLYAIAGQSQLAASAWPKFHHDLANTGRAGAGR